jgi:hypothetical protein
MHYKRFLVLSIFVVILFQPTLGFSPTPKWISCFKEDDFEVFYRYEKSGSDSYDVEIKAVNKRAKDIDILLIIAPVIVNQEPRQEPTKLTVKAKSTLISNKIEYVSRIGVKGVKIIKWCYTGSTNCNLSKDTPY